jgi:hypothetical protein
MRRRRIEDRLREIIASMESVPDDHEWSRLAKLDLQLQSALTENNRRLQNKASMTTLLVWAELPPRPSTRYT